MNSGEQHRAPGGEFMGDEQDGRNPALTELRRRLEAGLARTRLNKTQLARQAHLGRTTASEAFQLDGPVPSAATLAAVARVLKLPAEELLELRRIAIGESSAGKEAEPGPGRPIGQWEPHALEVHPAGPSNAASGPDTHAVPVLSGYVRREHDRALARAVGDAAAGRSRIVVLVGSSSTGKTRACWEAVQALADKGWKLWHPFDPTRAEAALEDLRRVQPRTVVWLNEAQHYLGDRVTGERIAAAVHDLLVSPERGPVLVLGTLWSQYAAQYMALPTPGEEDPHSRVRELLSGHTLTIPEAFDTDALVAAAALAKSGDLLLRDALTRVGTDGRVTQDLAGAPELLNRYRHAAPAARALLDVAMDARRLGVGLHLPQVFLTNAAPDYLIQADYDQLTDNWADQAFTELAMQVHGKQAPLRRTKLRTPRRSLTPPSAPAGSTLSQLAEPVFRLNDYLEQHGRNSRRPLCPPASFWDAAYAHLTHPDELNGLAEAAERRHRLQWGSHLRHRAADLGHAGALYRLAMIREGAGDREAADVYLWQAADLGNDDALLHLAELRHKSGDWEGAETLARQAADLPYALGLLAEWWEIGGDPEGAEALGREAADCGNTHALYRLSDLREITGREGVERLAREAADRGNIHAVFRLAYLREMAKDWEAANTYLRQAVDLGDTEAEYRLIELLEWAGNREGAEALAREAASRGNTHALTHLAWRVGKDRKAADAYLWQAADLGDTYALEKLAVLREEGRDREGAETLARQAADLGDVSALLKLAVMRKVAEDSVGATALARQAADYGWTGFYRPFGMAEVLDELWPEGLNPDGTPTPPW